MRLNSSFLYFYIFSLDDDSLITVFTDVAFLLSYPSRMLPFPFLEVFIQKHVFSCPIIMPFSILRVVHDEYTKICPGVYKNFVYPLIRVTLTL